MSARLALPALLGSLGLALATGSLPPSSYLEQSQKAPSNALQTPLLTEDKGRLRMLLDGQPVGTEEFEISPTGDEWVARGKAEVNMPGAAPTVVSGKLRLRPDGVLLQYEWSAQGSKKASATIGFRGGTATMELRVEGSKPFTQQFFFDSPRVVILDDNLYHHYALLARLYDWSAKGAQTFPVLIPQEVTPGTITVESLGPREVDGAKLELLRVRTADLEVDLYLDGLRLVRLAVPAAKALVLRE